MVVPRIQISSSLTSFYVTENNRTRDISKDYMLQSTQIGQPGQFGRAYICIRKTDRQSCAVKVIDKSRFIDSGNAASCFEAFRSEIDVMQTLDHPNIIQLYDVYEDKYKLMLVMELCCGGELFDRIAKKAARGHGYNEKLAANILKQILSAVACMHKLNICHCDLKPSNILFSTTDDRAKLKVIDFGYAQRVPKWKRYLHQRCGTIHYIAPEVAAGNYNKEADLWSIGVIMFAMFFGYTPFQRDSDRLLPKGDENYAVINRIQQGFKGLPDLRKISDEAADLIKLLLKKDVKYRYNANRALMHPWFETAGANQEIPQSVLDQLQQVSEMDNFKVLIVSAIGNDLDLTMTKQLQKYFEKFDTNEDKRISLREFEEGLNKFWPQWKVGNVGEIFRKLDIDGDNYIQLDEFMCLIAYQHLVNAYDSLKHVFDQLDSNQDGYLDKDDMPKLKQAMENDTLICRLQIDADAVVESADLDNDGRVSFDEFLFAMHPELVEAEAIPTSKPPTQAKVRGRPLLKSKLQHLLYKRLHSFDIAFSRILSPDEDENCKLPSETNYNSTNRNIGHSRVARHPSYSNQAQFTSKYSVSQQSITIKQDITKKQLRRKKKRRWFTCHTCSSNHNY